MSNRLTRIFRNFLSGSRVERDLNDEVSSYLQMLTDEKVRNGASPAQARRAAAIEFGGVEQVKEQVREARAGNMIETIWQDLRYGLRTLRKSPGFTVVAVLTLALGIGANSAIFSVVNAVLLRPLPFEDPDRLVELRDSFPSKGIYSEAVSPADFQYWLQNTRSISDIAAYYNWQSYNLTGTGDPERLNTTTVSPNFFRVLGVRPQAGRDFTDAEGQPGQNSVVIISDGLWKRRFAGDSAIIGRTISLDRESYTIVGVMPAAFNFPAPRIDIWVPIALSPERSQSHGHFLDHTVARLAKGATIEQLRSEMDTIANRLAELSPESNRGCEVTVNSLAGIAVNGVRPALLLLLAAVGLVLLVACSNIANLMLVRAASRRKEMALRAALGGRRARLIRQLLTETAVISLAGGAVGLTLAYFGVKLLVAASGSSIPRADGIGLDARVLGFTLLLSLMTGVVSGLVPALQASRPDLVESLKEGGRSSAGKRGRRIRVVLVVSEFALAFALLIGVGLIVKSFMNLRQVNPGFDPRNILTMSVALPESKYRDAAEQNAFFDDALQRVRALAGVESAAAVWPIPLSGPDLITTYRVEGHQYNADGSDVPTSNFYDVTPGYFETIGTRLLRGRYFNATDGRHEPRVVIISETFARRCFPGEDPIGKRLLNGGAAREVVGVVEDVKEYSLDEESLPQAYEPVLQDPSPKLALVMKTAGAPRNWIAAVRSQVTAIDSDQPVADVATMDGYLSDSLAIPRLSMTLMVVFGLVGLALAAVGLYGVIAYSVTQRSQEIAIRMALGARRSSVLSLVLREGLTQAVAGLVVGLAGALALMSLISKLLFGVKPTDPATFAVISVVLVAVALLASYIPARRASRTDPNTALRSE